MTHEELRQKFYDEVSVNHRDIDKNTWTWIEENLLQQYADIKQSADDMYIGIVNFSTKDMSAAPMIEAAVDYAKKLKLNSK